LKFSQKAQNKKEAVCWRLDSEPLKYIFIQSTKQKYNLAKENNSSPPHPTDDQTAQKNNINTPHDENTEPTYKKRKTGTTAFQNNPKRSNTPQKSQTEEIKSSSLRQTSTVQKLLVSVGGIRGHLSFCSA